MNRSEFIKHFYQAYAKADRGFVESAINEDFTFSSPPDPLLDRAGYFERCWPGAGKQQSFDFVRVIEQGDTVVVTYEMAHEDGSKGRNTEVFTFTGDKISRVEVYFGWDVKS